MDMDIEMKLLRAFVALVEVGNYRVASEQLFITQPALTKQIQAFERAIDRRLFIRGRNGAKLTEVGKALYPEVKKLLQQNKKFLLFANNIKKNMNGVLSIGFGISCFQHVPKWIRTFSERNPQCHVSAKQLPSNEQITLLMQGELDIGFVRMPVPESLSSIMLFKEYIVLAVPNNLKVSRNNLKDVLETHPLLHINPYLAPCLTEQTKLLLEAINAIPKQGGATNDLPSLLALIAAKNGIAFVPASVCHFLPKGVKLVTLELAQTGWDIAVAWNEKIENKQRDLFLEMNINHITNVVV